MTIVEVVLKQFMTGQLTPVQAEATIVEELQRELIDIVETHYWQFSEKGFLIDVLDDLFIHYERRREAEK